MIRTPRRPSRALGMRFVAGLVCLLAALAPRAAAADADAGAGAGADGGAVSMEARTPAFARLLEIPAHVRLAEGAWVQVTLDATALAGAAPDLRDVRIVDRSGVLVPFRLRSQERVDRRWNEIGTVEVEWKAEPGSGWVAELATTAMPDLTVLVLDHPSIHGRKIDETGEATWESLELRPVLANQTVLALPPGDGRWRLETYGETGSSSPPRLGRLYQEERHARDLQSLRFERTSARFEGDVWVPELRLAGPARSLCEARIRFPGAGGSGPIGVELHDDEMGGWFAVATDQRNAEDDSGDVLLDWDPISRCDRMRLRVYQAAPPAEPIEVVDLYALTDRLEFRMSEAGPFHLLYGDPYLTPREWTLEPPEILVSGRIDLELGPEIANPFAAPPRGMEWLRRHPTVLSIALFAVLLLLAVVVFTVRKREPESQ